MASVTQRIKEVKQPYGGYLPIKSFEKNVLEDNLTLYEEENISSALVGMAIDYLTRFSMGDELEKAFHISLLGAKKIKKEKMAGELLKRIKGLDDESITCACKLVGFDVCYRSSISEYKPVENIMPDAKTIENIRIMVKRSNSFWSVYGPIVSSEPTFDGGYTEIINTGDGDFLTADTLWDFKVSNKTPTSKHTLQLLVYYILAQHSIRNEYKQIQKLGIFNPRLNTVYICSVNQIEKDVIEQVSNDVIGYGNSSEINNNNKKNAQKEYTVSEISQLLNLKKSLIYNDIKSGKLNSYKKGNKYLVSSNEYLEYEKSIKNRKIIAKLITAIGAVVYIVLMIIIFKDLIF